MGMLDDVIADICICGHYRNAHWRDEGNTSCGNQWCGCPKFRPDNCAIIDVMHERLKQNEKWGEQNHNPYIYLAILLEEVGELAQAILQTQFGGSRGGWSRVRREAVQAAAVAVALIECLDRNKWRPDDVRFGGVK